jgi:predicted DNA-binding transcriptional regulator YafY
MGDKIIEIDYTNWRGERAWRKVQPISVEFTCSEWHPENQWLMLVWDFEKQAYREFALSGIHGTRPNTGSEK